MRQPRGFAILVVLAVLAAASVVIATQLASVEGQQGMQIRITQEMKARGVAERCLEVADAYAEAWAGANTDFDGLLDPNGTIEASGDDFLPPAGLLGVTSATVTAPPSASGKMYQYRAFLIGSDGHCLVRYDDNSDDSNPNLPSAATTSGVEGTGVDVPERDRDRTIITTVIGIVPQQADQSTAYAKAHARATVRRVRSMPEAPTTGSAIEAGGSVFLNGDVCGSQAGVTADSVEGGLCVCGVLDAQLISGSQGGCKCDAADCPASTGSDTSAGDRDPPNVVLPTYDDLLANEAFGGPGTTGNNIGAATYPAIPVYIRDAAAANPSNGGFAYSAGGVLAYQAAGSADVFAWDRNDDDPATTLASLTLAVGAFTTCSDTSTLDPLPRPCKWTPTTGVPTAVTCTADESPCWKLVARLDATAEADIDIRPTVNRQEHATGSSFTPRTGDLPNFKGSGGTARWRDFTSPASCTGCGAVNAVTKSGSNYTFPSSAAASSDVPHMVAIVDTISTATTTVNLGESATAKLTVLTNSKVDIPSKIELCCSNCDCSLPCAPDSSATKATNGPGFAIRTNQACTADTNNVTVYGTVMCPSWSMDASGDHCYVGGIIANESGPGSIPCTGAGPSFCDTATSICGKNNPVVLGDIIAGGNICMKNNFEVIGTIQTETNIGWNNNAEITGNIKAEGDIEGTNNAIINFSPSGAAATSGGRPHAMWMDATW